MNKIHDHSGVDKSKDLMYVNEFDIRILKPLDTVDGEQISSLSVECIHRVITVIRV